MSYCNQITPFSLRLFPDTAVTLQLRFISLAAVNSHLWLSIFFLFSLAGFNLFQFLQTIFLSLNPD